MSLVTIIEECLREHPVVNDAHNMQSYCLGLECPEQRTTKPWGWGHTHQAEQVAARLGIEPFIPALTIRPVFRVRALEGSDVPTE